MSERDQSVRQHLSGSRRPLGGELIIPIGTIAFAVYYLYTIWELPWQAGAAGLGITGAMAIVLAVLGIRFFAEWRRGAADLALGDLVHPLTSFVQRVGLLLAALGFIFAMNYLGFTISLFLFLMVGIVLLSGFAHLRKGLILAACVSLGGYLLFILFVRARFPHGPFEHFFASLL
jgi:hypothetical protein